MDSNLWKWIDQNLWFAEILVVFSLLLGVNLFFRWFFNQLKKRSQTFRTHVDQAALGPLQAILWIFLVSCLIDISSRHMPGGQILPDLSTIRDAAIVVCVGWFLLRWKKIAQKALAAKRNRGQVNLDPVSLEVIGKLFTILVLFVTSLIILQRFGFSVAPLITFGGIGAAALGIAGKDVIANFFGGLMLYATRPFTIGDQIEVPEKKLVGYIEEIGWYLTSVRDLQKRPIYVPNSVFSTELVVNLSRMTHRRFDELISIRMGDLSRAEPIVAEIRHLFQTHPQIDLGAPLYVHVSKFGAYSIDLDIKGYTLSTKLEEFLEIKQQLLLQIFSIVEGNGAQMPNPSFFVELKSV
jgi:MscS family membrane protein